MHMNHTKLKDCPTRIENPKADCLFCQILQFHERPIFTENELFVAVFDHYPVSEGHALVFPRRHTTKIADLTPTVLVGLGIILKQVQELLRQLHNPDGYNIGVNEGVAAGQTIPHLHIHVIPRYTGDVEEPRGGIRNIKQSLIPY